MNVLFPMRIGVFLVIAASALGQSPIISSDVSSCMSAKTREECKSQVEEGTGDPCVWCTCQAVPSECLGISLAKKLPKSVFTCDMEREPTLSTANTIAEQEMWLMFDIWLEKHGVSYADPQEEMRRFAAFKDNIAMVAAHNQLGSLEHGQEGENAAPSYFLGLNQFADMTWEEFQATRLGFGGEALGKGQNCSATHLGGDYQKLRLASGRAPPARRDWRELGAVSVVKDQSSCGSCWTFSTTGCLESHNYLRNGERVLLSEQQLLDCAQAFDNHGCNGGLPSHAFEYIASSGGLDTEKSYPYMAEESGLCSFSKKRVGASVLRSVNITFQDEEELLDAVGNIGPVSVAFEVTPDFKAYAGGVYDNSDCDTSPDKVNHAVLAVGYDTSPDGLDYWIIKNSWGERWGLDGYFHMARGKNMCGVADCAAFPLLP